MMTLICETDEAECYVSCKKFRKGETECRPRLFKCNECGVLQKIESGFGCVLDCNGRLEPMIPEQPKDQKTSEADPQIKQWSEDR